MQTKEYHNGLKIHLKIISSMAKNGEIKTFPTPCVFWIPFQMNEFNQCMDILQLKSRRKFTLADMKSSWIDMENKKASLQLHTWDN